MMDNILLNISVSTELLHNFYKCLVNRFFKILPLRENNEETLIEYMQSLQLELVGSANLIPSIKDDPDFLTILSILQYLIDNPNLKIPTVKREVFRAISVCNRLRAKTLDSEVL